MRFFLAYYQFYQARDNIAIFFPIQTIFIVCKKKSVLYELSGPLNDHHDYYRPTCIQSIDWQCLACKIRFSIIVKMSFCYEIFDFYKVNINKFLYS